MISPVNDSVPGQVGMAGVLLYPVATTTFSASSLAPSAVVTVQPPCC